MIEAIALANFAFLRGDMNVIAVAYGLSWTMLVHEGPDCIARMQNHAMSILLVRVSRSRDYLLGYI